MGMGPPMPPGAAPQNNDLNNLLAEVQQVTRAMKGGSNAVGGRVSGLGGLQNFADGGAPDDDDAALPDNATLDSGTAAGLAALQNATFGQESNYGANPSTSSAGAVGPMQVTPGTFAQYATPGEAINNPADNRAVGNRILESYYNKYNGDPARAAVAYYSGPGNVAPPDSPTPWIRDISRDRNGNPIKPVSSYVSDVLDRMGDGDRLPSSSTLDSGSGIQPASPSSLDVGKPNLWEGLMAAGLGMMAGQSPHALTNIGQGGLAGLQNIQQQREQLVREATAKQGAQRLANEAANQQALLKLQTERLALAQQQEKSTEQYRQAELNKPQLTTDPLTGARTAVIRDPNSPNGFRTVDLSGLSGGVPLTGRMSGMPQISPKDAQATQVSLQDALQTGIHGDEFLKSLPPTTQNLVKTIAEGNMSVSPYMLARNAPLMALVTQYDPTFNERTAAARMQAYKNYTGTGIEARNFTSNDMAIKHIGSALSHIEDMGNNSLLPSLNTPYNAVRREFSPQFQQARTALMTDVHAVSDELMRTFRGSGSASEKEAEQWARTFPINGSPVEQRTAFQEAANLLASRITAAGNRYNDVMGPANARDPLSWLSPEGQRIIKFTTSMDPQEPVPKNFDKGPATSSLSAQDKQALDWANANPKDPRAAAIKKKLGVQ